MINARILVRKGLKSEFDPTKMLPGEWAVSIDASTSNQIVWMCFAPGVCKRMGTYEDFKAMIAQANGEVIEEFRGEFEAILNQVQSVADDVNEDKEEVLLVKSDILDKYIPQIKNYVDTASAHANNAKTSEGNAKTSENNAKESENNAKESAEEAQTYAEQALSTTPEGYNQMVSDVDLLKNAIVQTSERTLEGSHEGGIKLIGIEGASVQGKNPSPDNPQENESVGDIKNWLEVTATSQIVKGVTFTVNEDKSVTVNGKATENAIFVLNSGMTFEADEEYAYTNGVFGGGNSVFASQILRFNGTTQDGSYSDIGSGTSFKGVEGRTYTARIVVYSGVTINNVTLYPMIRKASVKNAEYKPYGYSLGIKASGKNLFNPDELVSSYVSYENGVLTVHQVGSSSDVLFNAVFKENTQYTLSGYSKPTALANYNCVRVRYTDGTSEVALFNISSLDYEYRTFTTKEEKTVESICNSAQNGYLYLKEFQVEEGTVATPYEPYRSKSITIPLSEPLREGDGISVVDGVWGVNRGKGKETVDGNTDITVSGASNGRYRITVTALYGKVAKASSNEIAEDLMCTHYVVITASETYNGTQGIGLSTGGNIMIFDNKFTTADISLYKARLAENPIEIIYPLATPTFEPFTDQTPFYGLESFDTATYISTDSEIEPNVILKFGKVEASALALGNYNRTKLNENRVSTLEALTTELSAALVAGREV